MTPPHDATPQGGAPAPGDAPRSIHQPPPGAHAMNVLRWVLFAFLLVLAVVSIGSYVVSRFPAHTATHAAAGVIWQCPMHPSYTSDKPGACPICGMSLVQVRTAGTVAGPRRILRYRNPMNPAVSSSVPMKDEMGMDYVPVWSDEAGAGAGRSGDVPGLTSVDISPERVQLIGVRTARVESSTNAGRLDLVGFVAPDESRLRRVQLRVSGWVRELYANQTGERVTAGQPLLAIYSPELLQTEQEYLIERGGLEAMPGMDHADAGSAAAERLRLLGVPDQEIRRLEREGRAEARLVLRSPVTGTVLERGVAQGQFVTADTPLLTVADLSRVWVMADVYEMDYSRVHVGDAAEFSVDALPGRSFPGRIEFVYPTVSSDTRTLKARLSLATDGSLRPGMYGRVRLSARGALVLWVPSEAVVNTGEDSYVFLAHAGGRFEPRRVWTGLSEGDRVQVLRGVAAGDTVVASASFLIDSESRLKAAIEGMGAQPGAAKRAEPDRAGGDAR